MPVKICIWVSAYSGTEPCVNTLRPRHNGRHFADDVFKCIFVNENGWILLKISLKFVPKGPINNIPSLVQVMAWRRPGDKPLSEPMMMSLMTHISATRPQWVNWRTDTCHTIIWPTFVWCLNKIYLVSFLSANLRTAGFKPGLYSMRVYAQTYARIWRLSTFWWDCGSFLFVSVSMTWL